MVKITRISEVVGEGRVLADANHGIVRGWCENPRDGRTLRAIRRFFPDAEVYGQNLVRLGGFRRFSGEDSLVEALTNARLKSRSQFIKDLYLFENMDGEGIKTIIKAGLLTPGQQ
jgi:hypothetical protein